MPAGGKLKLLIRGILYLSILTPLLSQELNPVQSTGKDTLQVEQAKLPGLKMGKLQIVHVSVTVALGLTTYLFYQLAEHSYDEYLHSGSIDQMNGHYNRAAFYDTCTAISFAGTQVSIIFLIKAFGNAKKD